MTITNKPDEKYAYLFATDVSMRYLRDLENVYNTLIQYYSYPDTNIWIVFRDIPAAADLALLPGLTAATKKFVLPAAFTEAEILETFEDGVTGKGLLYKILADPPCVGIDEKKVLLMYVTGTGNNGNLLTTSDAVPIDNDWLEQRFMWFDPASMPIRSIDDVCQVHAVMQQPFGESLKNSVLGLSSYSFTFACANGQASSDGSTAVGSYFTVGWTKALQFEKLPATAPNSPNLYADEIGVVLPAVTNLLINMRQAQLFAVDYCLVNYAPGGTNSSPNCDTSSTDPYLGKPVVRIKDGSERVPPRSWVESPDIWITCLTYYPEATSYDNDYYVYDEDNTIHLRAHVEGTHPVRQIFIGSKIFRSGGG